MELDVLSLRMIRCQSLNDPLGDILAHLTPRSWKACNDDKNAATMIAAFVLRLSKIDR